MKKARIINMSAWAIVDIAICIGVCIQWHAQGCEASSLWLAVANYTAMIAGVGFTIDQTIKERN